MWPCAACHRLFLAGYHIALRFDDLSLGFFGRSFFTCPVFSVVLVLLKTVSIGVVVSLIGRVAFCSRSCDLVLGDPSGRYQWADWPGWFTQMVECFFTRRVD